MRWRCRYPLALHVVDFNGGDPRLVERLSVERATTVKSRRTVKNHDRGQAIGL